MRIIAAILLMLCGTAQGATVCADLIGSCDYYRCREIHQACGADGYLLNFGARYCDTFLYKTRPRMSEAGAVWMDRVAVCLQASLESLPLRAQCDETEDFAIAQHADCYIRTGYCDLPARDKFKVIRVVLPETADPRVEHEFRKIQRGRRRIRKIQYAVPLH